jgi:hypothetical protein
VALAPLQQSDGSVKNHPVVLLRQMPPFGDWLVCGVSTQLRQRVAGSVPSEIPLSDRKIVPARSNEIDVSGTAIGRNCVWNF